MSILRTSTLAWAKEVFQADEHHRRIINKIAPDRTVATAQQPPPQQQQPINILVLAGGGAKGSALLGMGEGLQDLNGGDDFLQYFDLVCGTSIGGIGSLLLNQEGTVAGGVNEARAMLETIRKHSFARLNWLNLFANGSLIREKNSMALHYQAKYGDRPLFNPRGPKCFALACLKNVGKDDNDSDGRRPKKQVSYEPFVLRTYDVDYHTDTEQALPGTSDIFLWEALAATSAAPVLADRIDVVVDGVTKRLADGGLIANNPTAIAVLEAATLWPDRPIGIVVSLDLCRSDATVVDECITVTKQHHPDMQFYSFLPPSVSGANPLSSDKRQLTMMASDARQYIRESKEARTVMGLLRDSGARRMPLFFASQGGSERRGLRSSRVSVVRKRPSFVPATSDVPRRSSRWLAMGMSLTSEMLTAPISEAFSEDASEIFYV